MKIQNIFDLPSLDSTRRSTVGLLAALLLSLFLVGCGGDGGGGNFVATPDTGGAGGGNNTNTGTGTVTFNFVRAQSSPIVVPVGTTRLRFEFFNAPDGDGNMVYRVSRDYNDRVVVEDVPTTSRSVVVTAFDADGFPIVQFVSDFTIANDQDITISQTDGTTSNVTLDELVASPQSLSLGSGGTIRLTLTAVFSSGDRVTLNATHLDEVAFGTSNSSVATVSAGVVSSVSSGTANITATFRGVSATVPVQVNTGPTPPPIATGLSIDPETLLPLPVGSLSEALTITATIQGSGDREVTFNDGLTYISSISGVTVTNDLKIQIASSVPAGTVATVTFRYLGQTASIDVTVVAKTLVDLTFIPSSVSIPFGQFSLPVEIRGVYSDGTDSELPPSAFTFTTTSSRFTVDSSGSKLVVTSAASGSAGSGDLTVSSNSDPVTRTLTVSVGSVFVRELLVNPSSVTLNPGQAQEFTVTAVFSDDRTVDVTDSANLQVSLGTGDAGAVLNGTRVVATVPGASRQINFVYPGTGNGGANVSATATLTVVPVTLTNIKIEFAGKELADVPVVNLPRGYVGVFEVIGTYSNGSTRRLEANEYAVSEDRETLDYDPDPNHAVELFDNTYSIPRANDTTLNDAGDIVFNQRTETTSGSRSTRSAFLVKDTFRAVVADWRRYEPVETGGTVEVDVVVNEEVGGGETSVVGGNIGNFDLFKIEVFDADGVVIDSLTRRNIQVAVTDPIGVVTVASGAYANRPEDPNLLIGTPREFDVLVDFEAAQAEDGENDVDPPTYSPPAAEIKNFKLAEANLLFVNDISGGNPNLVSHRPTPIGLPALFVNNAVQVTNLEVSVVPIGGFGGRIVPVLPTGFQYAYDTFGPATAVNAEISDTGAARITYTYFPVDNQGAGFDIVVASVLTLEPVLSPFNLQVGRGQYFRTIAIYGAGQSPVDVSLDYRPIVTSGEGSIVISESSVDTGVILVNGIATGSAVVQALDVDNAQVPARAQGPYTDIYGNTATPTTRVDINVTPP